MIFFFYKDAAANRYLVWLNKYFQFSRSSYFNIVPELKVLSHSSLSPFDLHKNKN